MATGDAIAVASLSLAGLGMIRAFSALTALDLVDLVPPPPVRPLIALLIGAVLAVGPWFAAGPVLRMIARWDGEGGFHGKVGRFLTPGKNSQNDTGIDIEPQTWLRVGLMLSSVAVFLLLAARPRQLADFLGVLAAAILALSVLALGAVPQRPTMDEAFEAWMNQDAGGGCGGHSALFSTGASGGALGLSLGRFTTDPAAAARSISGHQALGAAMISLLSGDLLATSTGLRVNASTPYRDPKRQPLDRAGLMETRWEDLLPGLRTPFLAADKDAAANDGAKTVTGQLVLNSTATHDGCIALVSQIDLSAGETAADGTPVCGSEGAGPHNYDFFGFYGRSSNDDAEHCVGNLPALAGTMLANRFPYVTPSGTAARCRGLDPAQLVDGGYTDNTGLGTIVDLAPHWSRLVKDHNDKIVRDGTGEFVVPMVVYVENGTGPDFSTGSKATLYDSRVKPGTGRVWPSDLPVVPRSMVPLVPEVVAPLVTKLVTAKGDGTNSRELLSEVARRLTPASLCTSSTLCDQLKAQKQLPNNVFVVHQSKQPSLSAPLGWALSETSQNDLKGDLATQAKDGCSASDCYPTLHDLVAILTPKS